MQGALNTQLLHYINKRISVPSKIRLSDLSLLFPFYSFHQYYIQVYHYLIFYYLVLSPSLISVI